MGPALIQTSCSSISLPLSFIMIMFGPTRTSRTTARSPYRTLLRCSLEDTPSFYWDIRLIGFLKGITWLSTGMLLMVTPIPPSFGISHLMIASSLYTLNSGYDKIAPSLPVGGSYINFTNISPLTSWVIQSTLVVPQCLPKQESPLILSKQLGSGCPMPSKSTFITTPCCSLPWFMVVPLSLLDCILVHPIVPHSPLFLFFPPLSFPLPFFWVSHSLWLPTFLQLQVDSTLFQMVSTLFTSPPTFPYSYYGASPKIHCFLGPHHWFQGRATIHLSSMWLSHLLKLDN